MSTLTVVPNQPARLREQVAAEVRAHMARVRINQTQLAEALGITQSSVSKRLRGVIAFNTDELEQVASVLGVHPAALLGGNPPSPNGPVIGAYPADCNTQRNDNVVELLVSSQRLGEESGAMRATRTAA
jgi:predicted XRE-type DNA-binding protein